MITIRRKEVSMDGFLIKNLENLKKMIEKNFDGVALIDGMEGSGKSEIGKQVCLYLDKKFSDENIVYTVEQFNEWVEKAKPGSACLWDEFVLAGLSADALTEMQKTLVKKFTMIRKRQLIIILVIPYLFMLKKYFAVARTRFLIHVYSKGMQRGFFHFYSFDQKLFLYNYGYKTWFYSPKVSPVFKGRFSPWSEKFIDEDKVQEKKDLAIESLDEEKDSKPLRRLKSVCVAIRDEFGYRRGLGFIKKYDLDIPERTYAKYVGDSARAA